MVQYSVDRIAKSIAVLIDETGKSKEVSVGELPAGVKECDILLYDGTSYQLDADKTTQNKEEVKSLIDSLFR